jgi:hypothetical protein
VELMLLENILLHIFRNRRCHLVLTVACAALGAKTPSSGASRDIAFPL